MKETSKVSHKLASSTSRQASNAKTERGDLRRAPEEDTVQLPRSGTATKQPVSLAAQERPRFLRHCLPGSRPGPPRQALCTPGHAPLTAKLSVSSRSKGKRNSRQRARRRASARSTCKHAQGTRGLLHRI